MSNEVSKIIKDALVSADPNTVLVEAFSDKTVALSIYKDGVSLAWVRFNGERLDGLIEKLKDARERIR